MDLDIMASVQEQIIGNCLCVLGDAMAMPVGSMIAKFRAEFEEHIEAARRGAGRRRRATSPIRVHEHAGLACRDPVLADAAPRAEDGHASRSTAARSRRPRTRCSSTAPSTATSRSPSSATSPSSASRSAPAACAWSRSRASPSCRPRARRRSRTAWSSTRRPTASRRPRRRSSSSCSINHPLDCPVCDKGGECPLQDITFGWGGGRSRFIEPKRHFEKPLELSPLVAIDRERCILCYRCVRFSPGGRRGLPARPPRARRAHLRRHLRRPPVRRAVQRQHHRAVPRRRADLAALPLPRAPVGHRGRGLGLHAVPVAVQRRPSPSATTASCACWRATTRTSTTAGSATRAASPTRRSTSTSASRSRWSATAASCAPSPGSARSTRPRRPATAGGPGRRARRRRGDQRGGLPAAAPHARRPRLPTSTRASAGALPRGRAPRAGRARRCRPRSPTSSSPTPCWCSAPSRSTTRRSSTCGSARACAATASSSRSPRRAPSLARPQRRRCRALRARRAARRSPPRSAPRSPATTSTRWPTPPAPTPSASRALAALLRDGGDGRRGRLGRAPGPAPRPHGAPRAARPRRRASSSRGRDGAGLLEVPAGANGRGLREAGVLPDAGPRLPSRRRRRGRDAAEIAEALAAGELTALYLLGADPLRDLPGRRRSGTRALEHATTVVAHASLADRRACASTRPSSSPPSPTPRRRAPSTHPDGRVQRLRPAIGRPGEVRAELERARRAVPSASALDARVLTGAMASAQLFAAVAVLRRPDARRDRRARRALARARRGRRAAAPADAAPVRPRDARRRAASPNGALRLGTFRSIWAAPEVEASPALEFLTPRQRASSSRPTTPSASASRRRARSTSRRTATRVRRDASRCAATRPEGTRLPRGRGPPRTTPTSCRRRRLVEVRKA